MGELTTFECDVTGNRFGARNDVRCYTVKRRWHNAPFEVREYTVCLCDEAVEESPVSMRSMPSAFSTEYIAVGSEEGVPEVVGVKMEEDRYRERGGTVSRYYEPFFEWFEEEALV